MNKIEIQINYYSIEDQIIDIFKKIIVKKNIFFITTSSNNYFEFIRCNKINLNS